MKVVITGTFQGIGLAIKEVFRAAGHQICAADSAYDTVRQKNETGEPEYTFKVDVSKRDEVEAFVKEAGALMGGIDVVINNAGFGGPRRPMEEFTDDEWHRVHAINLDAPYFMIRAALPYLRKSAVPSIINIVTTSVKTGLPYRLPYVTSKSALLALTTTLARELGPDRIRVNAIHPGAIENERGEFLLKTRAERMGVTPEEALKYRLGFVSLRTRMKPEDIAEMALFLSGPKANKVTGQAIAVDGNVEWED